MKAAYLDGTHMFPTECNIVHLIASDAPASAVPGNVPYVR